MWTLFQDKLLLKTSWDLNIPVGTDRIFRCLENTVWLALKALQSPLLSVDRILQGAGVQSNTRLHPVASLCKTAKPYRHVYKISCSIGFCMRSTGAAHASITQKAKNIWSIFVPTSRGFLLSVVILAGAHENVACSALNSWGPQGRKSAKQVSEVLLY